MRHTRFRKATLLAQALAMFCAASAVAQAPAQWAGQTFLTDYSKLKLVPSKSGQDWQYIAADAMDKLAKVTGVMVDQAEISISPKSPYTSAKPDDLKAIADLMRAAATDRLVARGYNVVDKPGPGVLYVRIALTDLMLEKKKRNLLAYTPVGAVVNAGVRALQDMMEKTDIKSMNLQSELVDSQSNEILGSIVVMRGATVDKATGQKVERIDFDEFKATTQEYGDRLACRVYTAKLPADKRIDCTDPAARATLPMATAGAAPAATSP